MVGERSARLCNPHRSVITGLLADIRESVEKTLIGFLDRFKTIIWVGVYADEIHTARYVVLDVCVSNRLVCHEGGGGGLVNFLARKLDERLDLVL